MTGTNDYPCLEAFSHESGIAPDRLVRAFEIERTFHDAVLAEPDAARRRELVARVYREVHPIYGKTDAAYDAAANPEAWLVERLRGVFRDKSVLDVGCGQGHLLRAIAERLPHGRLKGIDVSAEVLPRGVEGIEFAVGDIAAFDGGATFDVVCSNNVTEHVAPADLDAHLASVRRACKPGGAFVLVMPNRLFGPCDVTRILDNTYSNRIPAMGTHLNESTNREMMPSLRRHGFRSFRPIARVPLWVMLAIEGSPALLSIVYRLRARGRPVLARPIALVCR